MENEVTIIVKARNDTRPGLAAAERDARRAGERSGDGFGKGMSGTMTRSLSGLGAKLGPALAGAISSHPVIAAIAGLSVILAPALAATVSSAVTLAVGGGVLAAGIALVHSNPAVRSAFKKLGDRLFDRNTDEIEAKITAAQARFEKARFLGQAKGMASAKYDIDKAKRELEKAVVFNTLNRSLKDMAQPLVEPLVRAAKTFTDGLERMKPSISKLFQTIAPVIDRLAPALVGFLEKAMPGIQSAVEASIPLFNILADKLPLIGRAIGEMFKKMGENGPGMQQFFSDLLDLLIGLIIMLGDVISWLTSFYMAWREGVAKVTHALTGLARAAIMVFGAILEAAATALSWVPGLGPKLRTASDKFKEFRDRANGFLKGIDEAVNIKARFQIFGETVARTAAVTAAMLHSKSVTITTRFKTFGVAAAGAAVGVARTLHNMGYAHGGIVGAATGGLHSGLRMVGENGPELLDLPPGTNVHSNPDTQRMMSGGGGGAMSLTLKAAATASHDLMDAIIEGLRGEIRGQGGNVQQVLGVAGR